MGIMVYSLFWGNAGFISSTAGTLMGILPELRIVIPHIEDLDSTLSVLRTLWEQRSSGFLGVRQDLRQGLARGARSPTFAPSGRRMVAEVESCV